tara:strand:- start:181 stop:567 length:387 start_codon:yes stop_codon:yes gene_type:complete
MTEDEEEDLVVSLSVESQELDPSTGRLRNVLGAIRIIWNELTAGVGAWGSLKPLIAGALAVIPFLFLGQHFNRQHQKAFDWMLLQLPLVLTLILWPVLWLWSIFDAYRVAMIEVSEVENHRRVLELMD